MSIRGAFTIAGWEVRRGAAGIDRRTVIAALIVATLGVAIGPLILTGGAAPDAGIYRVAAPSDSPYAGPISDADALRRVSPTTPLGDGADLRIQDGQVQPATTSKGHAAMSVLRRAVAAYNDRLLRAEADTAAAFPVRVQLRYGSQMAPASVRLEEEPTTAEPASPSPSVTEDGESAPPAPDTATQPSNDEESTPADDAAGGVTDARDALLGGTQSTTPGGLTAPFPVRSLLLAFVFVLPLNVVIQAFGSSIMAERLDRRGEALLVAPISRYAVVAGKTLPYFLSAMVVAAVIAIAVGGGPVSVVAVGPLAALFLAATFVAALFARSYRELSFLTVAVSVSLTAFAFVPAVFTEIVPIAAISPLSIVVYDLTGQPLSLETVAFATVPATLVAGVLFTLGVGVFREQDLFAQRPVPAKLLDAFAAQLPTRRRVALWSALLVPFAFVLELFVIATLFAVRAPVTIPLLLTVIAVIEEFAKSGHVYAGFKRGRFLNTDRSAVVVGALSGIGFGLAEKLVLAVQAVGLEEISLARAAFAPIGQSDPLVVSGLLLAPFALHVGTAILSAFGARRSTRAYAVALCGAILIHVVYNLAVVSFIG